MKNKKIQINSELQSVFDYMPDCWGCKDKNSVFMYANRECAYEMGISPDKHLDAIGRTDYDLPGEQVEFAESFREQDKIVMNTRKPLQILDIHRSSMKGEWRIYLSTKIPLFDRHQNISGTIFHAANMLTPPIVEVGSYLSSLIADFQNPQSQGRNGFLLDTDEFKNIKLTDRESTCLFFLFRGETIKHIARLLGVSPKTVEHYVTQLKGKFSAHNKHELISKALRKGFLQIIPKCLLKKQILIILSE